MIDLSDDLAALRAANAERKQLRDCATPSPWEIAGLDYFEEDAGDIVVESPGSSLFLRVPLEGSTLPQAEADARFIAAARSDQAPETIDALIAEVESLRAGIKVFHGRIKGVPWDAISDSALDGWRQVGREAIEQHAKPA